MAFDVALRYYPKNLVPDGVETKAISGTKFRGMYVRRLSQKNDDMF